MHSDESPTKIDHMCILYIKNRAEMKTGKCERVTMKKLHVGFSLELPLSNGHKFGNSFLQVGFYNSSFCKRDGM